MFVATREQALKTCSEILKLKLDIRMQIIVMYLSSQVARLRRFLDGEANFDDYPDTDFPIESRQYTNWWYFIAAFFFYDIERQTVPDDNTWQSRVGNMEKKRT